MVEVCAHRRRHECSRMVRFQVCSLVGQQSVGSRVRFVEAILRELLHEIEYACRRLRLNAPRRRTFEEDLTLFSHLLGILFTHSTSQQIGST